MMKYFFAIALIIVGCKSEKRYHVDVNESSIVLIDSVDYKSGMLLHRANLDQEFKTPEKSPLSDIGRSDFKALNYFPIDSTYRITAMLELTPNEQPFLMPTTTERKSREVKYGILHFNLNGKERQLSVYKNLELNEKEGYEDYLFLPFTDQTNGSETYGGGRYLDLRIPKSDTLIIDFNKAYNPYCAYNKKYSCPIVPSENELQTEVRAGVKKYK